MWSLTETHMMFSIFAVRGARKGAAGVADRNPTFMNRKENGHLSRFS